MAAHTVFTLKRTWQGFSLLQAELKPAELIKSVSILLIWAFPSQADDKYGDFTLNKELARRTSQPRLKRMFLHASIVEVVHPSTGKAFA